MSPVRTQWLLLEQAVLPLGLLLWWDKTHPKLLVLCSRRKMHNNLFLPFISLLFWNTYGFSSWIYHFKFYQFHRDIISKRECSPKHTQQIHSDSIEPITQIIQHLWPFSLSTIIFLIIIFQVTCLSACYVLETL